MVLKSSDLMYEIKKPNLDEAPWVRIKKLIICLDYSSGLTGGRFLVVSIMHSEFLASWLVIVFSPLQVMFLMLCAMELMEL